MSSSANSKPERLDIDKPLWDQRTFVGRFKHFAFTTDPRTVLASTAELMAAKQLVDQYRLGKEPPNTTREQIMHARKLYGSAFHPDTGELQHFIGRMSFQMPGNCFIGTAMLTFYRSMPAVLFWQWFNQSFNAFVNYTNRNANVEVSMRSVAASYVLATTSTLTSAAVVKTYLQRTAPPRMQRFVPFAVVVLGNAINIPLMRRQEWMHGVEVADEDGKEYGTSRVAGAKGLFQVILSRVSQSLPDMVIVPMLKDKYLTEDSWTHRRPMLCHAIRTTMNVGFLTLMVPLSCAIFPQMASIQMSTIKNLDHKSYKKIVAEHAEKDLPKTVYFNKGL